MFHLDVFDVDSNILDGCEYPGEFAGFIGDGYDDAAEGVGTCSVFHRDFFAP
ncbi:hypothetical protein P405_16520 [Streptomyces sp. FR-008]|nr:hypothetical protein SFR_1821 [Streptomyces sp. FR-008]KAF0795766.1 hypothetical protein P405_16520 [Streptomyces sp. FR-008]